jgi:hypothetical protein
MMLLFRRLRHVRSDAEAKRADARARSRPLQCSEEPPPCRRRRRAHPVGLPQQTSATVTDGQRAEHYPDAAGQQSPACCARSNTAPAVGPIPLSHATCRMAAVTFDGDVVARPLTVFAAVLAVLRSPAVAAGVSTRLGFRHDSPPIAPNPGGAASTLQASRGAGDYGLLECCKLHT